MRNVKTWDVCTCKAGKRGMEGGEPWKGGVA